MIKKHVHLKASDFSLLYDYMSKMYNEKGMDLTFSRFIYTNLPTMRDAVVKTQEEISKLEQPKLNFDFNKAANELAEKYCDRDPQGNLITVDDEYCINDMRVEWQEELRQLQEKKDAFDKEYDTFTKKVNEIDISFDMYVLERNEKCPAELPPSILEIIETKLESI